jgi:hypothetical protein
LLHRRFSSGGRAKIAHFYFTANHFIKEILHAAPLPCQHQNVTSIVHDYRNNAIYAWMIIASWCRSSFYHQHFTKARTLLLHFCQEFSTATTSTLSQPPLLSFEKNE